MIVYKITNKINLKSYIGQTINSLEWRWKRHQHKSNCHLLFNAIRKYGKENFEIKVLAYCNNIEEMNHREQYYIKLFKTLAPNGYNLDSGGNNKTMHQSTKNKLSKSLKGRKTKPCSEETKSKIAASHVGKKASEETKAKLSKIHTGRKSSEETKKKVSEALTGKPKSDKHRASLSASKSGQKITAEHRSAISNGLKKQIKCNETGKIYDSTKDAALELGVNPSSIWHVLKGKCKTCKGLSFSYT